MSVTALNENIINLKLKLNNKETAKKKHIGHICNNNRGT